MAHAHLKGESNQMEVAKCDEDRFVADAGDVKTCR